MSSFESTSNSRRCRVFAWTIPRSRSTVFMKSISANGDVKAYLEPYATAEHFGPEGRLKPTHEVPAEPEYTVKAVKEWLETEDTTEKSVFVKDLAYAVDDQYHMIAKGYRHSFIIRNPDQVFKSYYRLFHKMGGDPEHNFKDWLPCNRNVYESLSNLVNHVEYSLKQDFVVIDTDDVVKSPKEMIQKYCETMGLTFDAGLLQWDHGLPETWCIPTSVRTAEDEFHWMTNAVNSKGWGVGITHPEHFESTYPPIVLEMVENAMPFYEKLRSHPKSLHLSAS